MTLRRLGPTAVVAVIFLGLFAWPTPAAADLAREDPDGAQDLAEKYAPVVMVKAQQEPCDDDGEPYGPTTVDIVLDNPEVLLRQKGNNDPVLMRAPVAADLFRLGEGVYLDFPGGSLEPGCIYESDFNRYSEGLPPVVYAHIVQEEGEPDKLAVQYWLYWYFNDWNNKHESDWEFIQILFEASSIDEALAGEPVSVGYAQHEGGERADWDASKLDRDGTHPVIYSSAGSHASYFGSALYLGRSGSEGFGCDNTDGPSERLDPDVVVLPDDVDDPSDDLAWLAYGGRWGERQRGPFNGPTGPSAKARWLEPVSWHDDLRSSSVVIPGGDSGGTAVITTFCAAVEWGSGVMITMTTSPLRLLVTGVIAVLVAVWLVRRTDWSQVPMEPLRRRRRAGQIIRLAGRVARRQPRALLTYGLVFIPTAFIAGLIAALVSILPVARQLLDVAGTASGTGFALAVFAGSFAHLAAFVAVNAMVAVHLDDRPPNDRATPTDAVRLVGQHWRPLLGGYLRAYVIVTALLITVIGIPFAIVQIVRYQFLPHAVMLEGLDAKAALRRSSELVRGRWVHTAVMIAFFNLVVGGAGTLVGLVLLVFVTGLPLWLFSVLVSLIFTLLVPVTAAAQTYLYGDALADREGSDVETTTPAATPA